MLLGFHLEDEKLEISLDLGDLGQLLLPQYNVCSFFPLLEEVGTPCRNCQEGASNPTAEWGQLWIQGGAHKLVWMQKILSFLNPLRSINKSSNLKRKSFNSTFNTYSASMQSYCGLCVYLHPNVKHKSSKNKAKLEIGQHGKPFPWQPWRVVMGVIPCLEARYSLGGTRGWTSVFFLAPTKRFGNFGFPSISGFMSMKP